MTITAPPAIDKDLKDGTESQGDQQPCSLGLFLSGIPKVVGPSSLPISIHVGSQQPVQAQGRLTAARNFLFFFFHMLPLLSHL